MSHNTSTGRCSYVSTPLGAGVHTQCDPLHSQLAQIFAFPKFEIVSKDGAKARATRWCSTSVLPLREPGVGDGTSHSPFKVRHHPVNVLKSGCSFRSAQTAAPARGIRQLAAACAAKLPMLSALAPGVTAAPAMRERCARAHVGRPERGAF